MIRTFWSCAPGGVNPDANALQQKSIEDPTPFLDWYAQPSRAKWVISSGAPSQPDAATFRESLAHHIAEQFKDKTERPMVDVLHWGSVARTRLPPSRKHYGFANVLAEWRHHPLCQTDQGTGIWRTNYRKEFCLWWKNGRAAFRRRDHQPMSSLWPTFVTRACQLRQWPLSYFIYPSPAHVRPNTINAVPENVRDTSLTEEERKLSGALTFNGSKFLQRTLHSDFQRWSPDTH